MNICSIAHHQTLCFFSLEFGDELHGCLLFKRQNSSLVACAVKHKAFSEEKEWRIITYPRRATLVGATPENYEGGFVRPTSKLLLSYMILEPPPRKRLPLIEARCGPNQFQDQSARALNILLRKHGYKNLPVTLSSIPLLA